MMADNHTLNEIAPSLNWWQFGCNMGRNSLAFRYSAKVEFMGVDLNWQQEDGELIDQVSDELGLFSRLVPELQEKPFICLRFLDQYGETVFNNNQIPVLISELKQLLPNSTPELKALLEAMIALAERAHQEHGTYLWFTGD